MSDKADCDVVLKSSLGQELNRDECDVLTSVMGTKRLKDGETLVKEGDTDNTLFVLAKGKLSVNSRIDGKDVKVYTMKAGECAGTRAFVDMSPRSATLSAVGDCEVYTMEPKVFETLLDSQPRIVYKVMRGLFRITHMNLMRMNIQSKDLANYIHKTGGRY